MNTPNKLTILRILLVPVIMFFMLTELVPSPWKELVSAAVFGLAALTDMIDGKMARKYNLVTDFGKFLDPVADKLMVIAALVCLCANGQIHPWIVMVIIAREFLVTSIRLVAAGRDGTVIAAGIWGKVKTVLQMVAILVAILEPALWTKTIFTDISMLLAAAMTIYSGADYAWRYRSYIDYRH